MPDLTLTTTWSAIALGEAAALGTAFCWVFTSLAFAAAGRLIGSSRVNLIRLFMAVLVLGLVHRLVYGLWLPRVDGGSAFYLAISGLIGLTIGDQLLFRAFVDIGPRLSSLLMTAAPPVAALLAWPVLDEPLGWAAVLGISITLAGIGWTILERPAPSAAQLRRVRPGLERHYGRGVVFAVLGAAGQAGGLVLSKLGMGHTRLTADAFIDPWPATLTRMAAGLLGMIVLSLIISRVRTRRELDRRIAISPEVEHLEAATRGDTPAVTLKAASDEEGEEPPERSIWPRALLFCWIGALFGPVVGVWLSLVAVNHAEAGIAATLMAMTPVFILPFAAWIERERITWRAGLGAVIAVLGVVVLTQAG